MSRAIEQMTGGRITGLSPAVSMQFLGALSQLCKSKQPIGKLAIVVSPETSYFALRAEIVDRFHGMQLHALAGRIARHSTRGSEILLVCIGDDEPTLCRIPAAAARYALAGLTDNEGKN